MNFTNIIQFASIKHKGQVDKVGKPYIEHPRRVADLIWEEFDWMPNIYEYMKVAILHDILEDTDTTVEELEKLGLSKELINGIISVTRKENESYSDFIKRASINKYGKIVKYCDLKDNLNITRLTSLNETDLSRLNKYLKWYHYLKTIIYKNN